MINKQENQHCVVIGMGHAAAQFIPSLRKSGWKGKISWFGNEGFLPYQRPPLSKDFLKGESNEPSYIRAAALYDKLDIDYNTNSTVTKIDAAKQCIELENDQTITYDTLVLATGGTVRKLNIPKADLGNIFYLRTLQDALDIKKIIQPNMKAVIIGGGYIGLEMAASLVQKNLKVTVLEAESRVLQRVTSPEISTFVTRYHNENGVKIALNKRTVAFSGNTTVQKVECADSSVYEADIVIVGIGIIPSMNLATSTGLEVGNGILVNEFGQTSNKNIYAIGDCSNHPSPRYQTRLRLESVPNAMEQAKIAASHICGGTKSYDVLPWFWSHQYDLKWQIAGLSTGYDEVVIRGDYETGNSFVVWYFKENQLIAADCLNRPMEFMVAKKLLTKGVNIPANILGDENVTPKELMKYTR